MLKIIIPCFYFSLGVRKLFFTSLYFEIALRTDLLQSFGISVKRKTKFVVNC